MYRTFVVLCLIGILICLTPVFGVVWSSWFAERHDCVLNEAGRHPCIVNGEDWGGRLHPGLARTGYPAGRRPDPSGPLYRDPHPCDPARTAVIAPIPDPA